MKYKVLITTNPLKIEYVNELDPKYTVWGIDDDVRVYAPKDTKKPLPGSQYSLVDTHLNNKINTNFENRLAALVLKNPELVMPGITKVNQGIIHYLNLFLNDSKLSAHKKTIVSILKASLYTSKATYGRLGLKIDAKKINDDEFLNDVFKILQESKDLPRLLLIYQVMVCSNGIYSTLDQRGMASFHQKLGLYNIFRKYHYLLFLNQDMFRTRDRRLKAHVSLDNPPLVTDFGYGDALPIEPYSLVQEHARAIDLYERPTKSEFAKNADILNLPLVCGPSGHTVEFLKCAKIFSSLSSRLSLEEFKQVILAGATVFIASGSHSFHEVMAVAKNAGLPYQAGDYSSALPAGVLESLKYKALTRKKDKPRSDLKGPMIFSDKAKTEFTTPPRNKKQKISHNFNKLTPKGVS